MIEAGATETLVDAVGDIPVVVRVEIGEATMTAREWAALRPGDVVTLGRRAGEHVVLRAGGVPVARGELVTVDGEVGVRVVERFGGDVTSRMSRRAMRWVVAASMGGALGCSKGGSTETSAPAGSASAPAPSASVSAGVSAPVAAAGDGLGQRGARRRGAVKGTYKSEAGTMTPPQPA